MRLGLNQTLLLPHVEVSPCAQAIGVNGRMYDRLWLGGFGFDVLARERIYDSALAGFGIAFFAGLPGATTAHFICGEFSLGDDLSSTFRERVL